MATLDGICPKCGLHYTAKVLANGQKQKCDKCGTLLEIFRDGTFINKKDEVPFEARECRVIDDQEETFILTFLVQRKNDLDMRLYWN